MTALVGGANRDISPYFPPKATLSNFSLMIILHSARHFQQGIGLLAINDALSCIHSASGNSTDATLFVDPSFKFGIGVSIIAIASRFLLFKLTGLLLDAFTQLREFTELIIVYIADFVTKQWLVNIYKIFLVSA